MTQSSTVSISLSQLHDKINTSVRCLYHEKMEHKNFRIDNKY